MTNKQYLNCDAKHIQMYYEDHRLRRASFLILYLSCVFPYKFLSHYQGTKIFEKIMEEEREVVASFLPGEFKELMDKKRIESVEIQLDKIFN